jgi:glycerol uptake facilitator-like aquaporin
VAELIGTFALVLLAAGAAVTSGFGLDLTGVGLATGLTYAALMSTTAPLGGGTLNPAIAVGLWAAGVRSSTRTIAVVIAQLAGAVLAALVLRYAVPGTAFDAAAGGTPAVASGIAAGKAVVIEAAGAFVLGFAFFASAVDPRGPRALAGLPAGLVLAAVVMAFGPSTGGAVNPARWFGPALASGTWADWYVWIVGPVAGAVIAAVAYGSAFLRDRPLELP